MTHGNDHDAKGNPIKQKFRSYNSMDEYAVDKLQFLKHLYDFDENDDINTFTAKLTGKNKGKRRYAEATDYADRVAAVFKSFKNGGVIKAQAGTIVADNTRVVKPTIFRELILSSLSLSRIIEVIGRGSSLRKEQRLTIINTWKIKIQKKACVI